MKLRFSGIFFFLLIAVDGRGLSVDDSFSNGFISLYKDSQVVIRIFVQNVTFV